MTALSDATTARAALIASVRSFIEGQLETWRLVPLLALQADGRDGGMGHYASAYEHGMWPLHIAGGNLHRVFIDCETGNIMFLRDRRFHPAGDDHIVSLSNHFEHLDPENIVSSLRSRILQPLPSWISPEQAGEREAARVRMQRQHNLRERYVRTNLKVAA